MIGPNQCNRIRLKTGQRCVLKSGHEGQHDTGFKLTETKYDEKLPIDLDEPDELAQADHEREHDASVNEAVNE